MEDFNQVAPEVAQLEACQKELAQVKESLKYLTADFENARRRTEKEKVQWTAFAQEAVLRDLLDIVDDFERSADLVGNAGFDIMFKNCQKMLQKYGVSEITENHTFNPSLHEAVMSVADETKESGSIAQVLQKGYLLKGAVLRPAKVSVIQ